MDGIINLHGQHIIGYRVANNNKGFIICCKLQCFNGAVTIPVIHFRL